MKARTPTGDAVQDAAASGRPDHSKTRGADRRQRHARFVLRERRGGFDRRAPDSASSRVFERALLRLRDDGPVLVALLALANILSLLDFFLTRRALDRGAGEANLLLRHLLMQNVWAAGAFKVLLVLLVSLTVWRLRRYRLVLLAGVAECALYVPVIAYQLYGLTLPGY